LIQQLKTEIVFIASLPVMQHVQLQPLKAMA
jgi:hypothetical protein